MKNGIVLLLVKPILCEKLLYTLRDTFILQTWLRDKTNIPVVNKI